jgi:uncharacterized protein with PIN domain
MAEAPRFVVDHNVGKLCRWLRLLGFDTLFFTGPDDGDMVKLALEESRIILTRDTHISERRLVTGGKIKVLLFTSDRPLEQLRQMLRSLELKDSFRPFTLCVEDNHSLREIEKGMVVGRVPPYVFKTQEDYMECPYCGRIYWRGTHWRAMTAWIEGLS